MLRIHRCLIRLAIGIAVLHDLASCSSARGEAVAIEYRVRGVSSVVSGSVREVSERAGGVLRELGGTMRDRTAREDAADTGVRMSWTLRGRDVAVEIQRESDSTSEVYVSVREGAIQSDRDMARRIVQRVMARSAAGYEQGP